MYFGKLMLAVHNLVSSKLTWFKSIFCQIMNCNDNQPTSGMIRLEAYRFASVRGEICFQLFYLSYLTCTLELHESPFDSDA